MNIQRSFLIGLILAAGAVLPGALPAAAEVRPSSDLLLPWFEVDLAGGANTTLFALANSSAEPVEVLVSVQTSWGIPVLRLKLRFAGGRVETVNLRDWLVLGQLPSGALGSGELAHVQAALSGRASPQDSLYYASPPAVPGRMVGSITFRVLGALGPDALRDALWGDFILLDSERGSALAEGLVNLDPKVEPRPDCSRHGLRFLTGHPAEMASELRLWTSRRGAPSAMPDLPAAARASVTAEIFDEAGRRIATHRLELPPVAGISLRDLAGSEPFGRIDLTTGESSFAGVVVRDEQGMTMLLPAVCLPAPAGPQLQLDVIVNGAEAPAAPGPSVPVGERIDWSCAVTNTGDVALEGIRVSDGRGIGVDCPGEVLAPGESMTCTGASAAALACQQEISADATARTPGGDPVAAGGSAYYFGGMYGRAAIDLETSVAGQDADAPPGPTLEAKVPLPYPFGYTMYWEYEVENTGTLPLSGVTVSDERGVNPECSIDTLAPGESTRCWEAFVPKLGLQRQVSKAAGVTSCGHEVKDEDPTYYLGVEPKTARIELQALVNGYDAETAPGPFLPVGAQVRWTYVVVNTGDFTFLDVSVSQSESSSWGSCPDNDLGPGESMTCALFSVALPGLRQVTATAVGYQDPWIPCPPGCGRRRYASDTDLVYYFGAAVVPGGGGG